MGGKLWGGRFEKETDRLVEEFTASIGVDARLWDADIRGSIAHARMLGKVGVLSAKEAAQIVEGLEAVRGDIRSAKIAFDPSAEDIHSEIEKALSKQIGPLAGKLHTGRSRNDQVVTATRLFMRDEAHGLMTDLKDLQGLLLSLAESHVETILPGLTHTQHAQPVSLAHHLLAYFWMFERDRQRVEDCSGRMNVLPLGSAALAGTSFPLDREMVARELGFDSISENSLDAVSDRDFVVEFLSAASLVMTHLSRISEELIYWSTPEFGFVELDDSVTTGSSIMPQKKNPDVAELIRGRAGRVTGNLMGALMMLKALPLSYNRDLQEDKAFLFEGLDVVRSSARLMSLMLKSAEFRKERMEAALAGDFSNATDLADHLVRLGLPFREAHEVVGGIVQYCIKNRRALEEISLEEISRFSPLLDERALKVLDHRHVMEARTTSGGTSPSSVKAQITSARAAIS